MKIHSLSGSAWVEKPIQNGVNIARAARNHPSTPNGVYKKMWTGWADFLGTGNKAQFKREYRTFEDARRYIRSLGFLVSLYCEF
jgi:hypothetical protein